MVCPPQNIQRMRRPLSKSNTKTQHDSTRPPPTEPQICEQTRPINHKSNCDQKPTNWIKLNEKLRLGIGKLIRPRKQFLFAKSVLMCLVICWGKEGVSPEHVPLTTSTIPRKNALHQQHSISSGKFPRSVGSWPLTLVALHNLQRITGTINGCLSDSEATARTAQVPLEILRLCCSNSTGNTPREDQVVHFSLSWWRQRKMQELIYI